ncbi:MAG: PEP-CTERM sorting domain-containing protein, partial [Verrucomicrobiales bacterium]
ADWYPGGGFATTLNNVEATPRNFSSGSMIDGSANMELLDMYTLFRTSSTVAAPDFGPGSFMGFKDVNGRFGYFEVTWTAATNEFRILSGAYESTPGVGIQAGAAIPEPSTAVLSLGALAAGVFVRRRKQAA